jgi:Coenzyme PQQ synthesis protein D (PqqD)
MPIELEGQVFMRSRSVVSRVVSGETLVVPVRGKVGDLASIYSFNGTGSLIWQKLDAPSTLASLVEAVEYEFLVGQEQAHRDVTKFMQDLLDVGLVDVSPEVAMSESDLIAMDTAVTESKTQAELESATSR